MCVFFPKVTFTNFGTTHLFEEISHTSKTHKNYILYHENSIGPYGTMQKTRCGGQGRPKGLMPFDSASIKITTLKWMAIVIPTSLHICNSH